MLIHARPELRPIDGGTTSPAYIAVNGGTAHASETDDVEVYEVMRQRALAERQAATGELPRAMQLLYKFWAHFLTTEFNSAVYKEFRQYAREDAAAPLSSKYGYVSLAKLYRDVLSKSHGGGLWPADHPIYNILRSHFAALPTIIDDSQATVNGSAE